MHGNVVTSKGDTLMYVVLRKAEKHVLYGKLAGTLECITLQPRCRINQGHYT